MKQNKLCQNITRYLSFICVQVWSIQQSFLQGILRNGEDACCSAAGNTESNEGQEVWYHTRDSRQARISQNTRGLHLCSMYRRNPLSRIKFWKFLEYQGFWNIAHFIFDSEIGLHTEHWPLDSQKIWLNIVIYKNDQQNNKSMLQLMAQEKERSRLAGHNK